MTFFILPLDFLPTGAIITSVVASVAHLVERHLAKVEVASSSLVTRSIKLLSERAGVFVLSQKPQCYLAHRGPFLWHSRGQRFDPAYLHHRSLENHWFSRLFAIRRYFYFARYFSDQSFDQNYEMSKKSNLFQEVGGSFLTSRFFIPLWGTVRPCRPRLWACPDLCFRK